MKTYSGKYKIKNPSKYRGNVDNVVYRSGWEKSVFMWCDNTSDVVQWSSEEVQVPYIYDVDNRYHRYFVDLLVKFRDGRTILVEIKPDKQTKVPAGNKKSKRYVTESLDYVKNQNKWEAATKYANKRGWEFQVWTEHTLRSMGILPKPFKKIKPLKPLRKKKQPKRL